MKKQQVLILVLLTMVSIANMKAQTKEKVILDADMVEAFDDGIAMMMLQRAENIELLGVTTVTGNTWSREGAAYAIRQLEAIGATNTIVAEGCRNMLKPHRKENILREIAFYGHGDGGYIGAMNYDEPESWSTFYRQRYGEEPKMTLSKMDAVDFITAMVKKYPHEVTLLVIGTNTNVALAVRKDPSIIPLIKRIVYMGGAYFCPGNSTQLAEFNIWADPEAAQIVFTSPFAKQQAVGLDVCRKLILNKEIWDELKSDCNNKEIVRIMENNFLQKKIFDVNPDSTWLVWDVIAASIVIDPTLIIEMDTTHYVDVCTDFGSHYGQTVPYTKELAPQGTQKVDIVLTINKDRFWAMLRKFFKTF